MRIRHTAKSLVNGACMALVSPCAFTCWLESCVAPASEAVFGFWTNVFAILPGRPGLFLRRAFYRMALDRCASSFYIGFGALFTHRSAIVDENAYIGPYCLIGSAHLGEGCMIASRVSVLSGTSLHNLDDEGRWSPADLSQLRQVSIGAHAWLGEGSIVMVDVGAGSLVGAGAVVSTRVRPGVVVAGNPARLLRRLRSDADEVAAGDE